MSYIMIEQMPDGQWNATNGWALLGGGATRSIAIMRARDAYGIAMQIVPLQPEEIPGELREIARRMLAVGHGVAACKTLESGWPTAEAMTR